MDKKEIIAQGRTLVAAHAAWVNELLELSNISATLQPLIKFLYRTSGEHFYWHGYEDCLNSQKTLKTAQIDRERPFWGKPMCVVREAGIWFGVLAYEGSDKHDVTLVARFQDRDLAEDWVEMVGGVLSDEP